MEIFYGVFKLNSEMPDERLFVNRKRKTAVRLGMSGLSLKFLPFIRPPLFASTLEGRTNGKGCDNRNRLNGTLFDGLGSIRRSEFFDAPRRFSSLSHE